MASPVYCSKNSMPDFLSQAKRSALMATIRSRGNRDTELVMVNLFRRHRVTGWRRNQSVFGKPDFVFKRCRLALFVDGCFWHCCPIHAHMPDSNRLFWREKFSRNKARDRLVTLTLRAQGWHVLRVWEHELAEKNESHILRRIQRVIELPTQPGSKKVITSQKSWRDVPQETLIPARLHRPANKAVRLRKRQNFRQRCVAKVPL